MRSTTTPTLYRFEPDGEGGRKAVLAFHEAQQEGWDADERFVAMVMGTQSGKTSFGPWWLWREIQRHGAGDYLAVSATFDLFKLKLLPELKLVFEEILGRARYWSSTKLFELADPETGKFSARRVDDPMWGRVILRSAASPAGLESASAKAAWLDEAGHDEFDITAWDAVRRRLSLSRGRVLITTTPYNLGWLKTEIMDKAEEGDRQIRVIQAPSTINPAFSEAEFEDAKLRMPGWKFDMFYRGLLARPPGLIYGAYIDEWLEEGGHKVHDFVIPPEWPRFAGIDFGPDNTAVLWIAHDPLTNVCYAYRESLEGGKTTRQHCELFIALTEGENYQMAFGGSASEKQYRWDWAANGVPVQKPLIQDVELGIDRGIELFQRSRLYVFESCRLFRAQLGSYKREVDKAGDVIEKIEDKRKFHTLDAYRYAAPWLIHLGPAKKEKAA